MERLRMKRHSTGPKKNFPCGLETALPADVNEGGLLKGETSLDSFPQGTLVGHLCWQVTLAVTLGIEMRRETQLLPMGA